MPETAVAASDAVRDAAARLTDSGVETPRLDAEVLLAWALGVGRERLVLEPDLPVGGPALSRFVDAVRRRAGREPVAYITGVRDFRWISLEVDRRVLIPRPETELLVEVGLTLPAGASVVDVGTGSGAVALALKSERPDLVVVGSDVDEDALALAAANGARLGLDVRFAHADLLPAGQFDAVLANLPYVVVGAELPPEIALYEPESALYAGSDGLELVRRLIAAAALVPTIALEVGASQAPAVASLMTAAGFGSVSRARDLAGHERVVVGRR